MITIEIVQGPRRGARIESEAPMFVIGRSPSGPEGGQLVLDVEPVAPEHAQIFREDDQYVLRDLGSGRGTKVLRTGAGGPDGALGSGALGIEELRIEGDELPLRDGDRVVLGDGAVVLAVSLPADDAPIGRDRIQAERGFSELDGVAANLARDVSVAPKLLAATQKLARRGLDLTAVFDGTAEAVFELLPRATHVAIALVDEPSHRFHTVYSRMRPGLPSAGETAQASRAVVRSVQRERYAVLVTDPEQQLGGAESIMGARIQSTLGVPLWEGKNIRGVIQVDNRGASGLFLKRELDLLVTLAGQATLAIENARLVQRLQLAEEQLRGENRYLRTREERRRSVEIVGDSPAMHALFGQIERVKDTFVTVCIEGETGTGKELIASAIHYQGSRRDKLFVAQNCAAVSEHLLESELFGHKRGAFTGADADKKGLFEIADGGTLFLDEVGELSLSLQAKLLRVLQERRIRPVGATQEKPVDVRIVCATNRSLEREVERGAFRQDLYYRLHVYPIRLPPLRERRDDIPLLVDHFLRKYTQEMKKPVAGVTPEALHQLGAYDWPGNIRELENEVQRLVIQADPEAFITPELLSPQVRKVEQLIGRIPEAKKAGTLRDRIEEVERWLLSEALREHDGNKTRTAEALGMTREGLHKKLSKFGM